MNSFDDFLSGAAEKVEAEKERRAPGVKPSYKIRLLVRLGGVIKSDEPILYTTFLDHPIEIRAAQLDAPLSSSSEIIFSATGFASQTSAVTFGKTLQDSLSMLGVFRGYPVDASDGEPSSRASEHFIKLAYDNYGVTLRGSPRGLEAYLDTPSVVHLAVRMDATVQYDPSNIINGVAMLSERVGGLDDRGRDAALLMNAAAMATHPVAQVALVVSAVELLAAGEKWNSAQKAWINDTRSRVATDTNLAPGDRDELASAMKAMLKFGALEKTRRLIRTLSLDELLPRWKVIYDERSLIVHAVQRVTEDDLRKLASEAAVVCRAIVRAYLEIRCGVQLVDPPERVPAP
jgi:hypothetical protein